VSRASRARRGTDAASRVFASRAARRPPERRRAGVPSAATLCETLQVPSRRVGGRWPRRECFRFVASFADRWRSPSRLRVCVVVPYGAGVSGPGSTATRF